MPRFEFAPLGDQALCVFAPGESARLAAHLAHVGLKGLTDVVPAFDHVGLYFDSASFDEGELASVLDSYQPGRTEPGKRHEIPLCYELGGDLQEVSSALALPVESVIAHHLETEVECQAIGFCPGYPYLGPIHRALKGLARKDTPAIRVEPGTVAIAGELCGIYTMLRPGGWWQIGRSPLTLVDVADNYFPLSVGDVVRFRRIGLTEFEKLVGERL